MEEDYSEDDDASISGFAASQNVTFYDHDWLEYFFQGDDQKTLLENVPGIYANLVQAIVKKKNIADCNGIILFYDEWPKPVNVVDKPKLWHLGQFDEKPLKKRRKKYKPESIPASFWTDFPQGPAEIGALEDEAQTDSASMIKLGILARCGINMDKDAQLMRTLFNRANASPVMRYEALTAVANLGYAEAWLELYSLSRNECAESATDDQRREYIETAVKLGLDESKSELASLLMYDWGHTLYEKDCDRAEELLLSITDFNSSGRIHQVYCLYSMKKDDENAFIWRKRDADSYGHSSTTSAMVKLYREGIGIDKDLTQAAKYLYLSLCQQDSGKLKPSALEQIEALSTDDLLAGRKLAKDWIKDVRVAVAAARGKLAHFSGEKYDPFEAFLDDCS